MRRSQMTLSALFLPTNLGAFQKHFAEHSDYLKVTLFNYGRPSIKEGGLPEEKLINN